jgi:guanine nucleotide-binding protein alpha-1 subunit
MLHARRPPSVYSQEDPLSFAVRPPDVETDIERRARIQREVDAKRISDIIDEQLKIDRRNFERSKQDVRVRFPFLLIPRPHPFFSSSLPFPYLLHL